MESKQTPEWLVPFGKYVNADGFILLKQCPICSDSYTFRFLGDHSLWECPSCKTSGDWNTLSDMLMRVQSWRDRVAELKRPKPPEGLIVVSEWVPPASASKRIHTGFGGLDRALGGLEESMLTIITGKRGEGKSTITSQFALNAVETGTPVCFYSGELNVRLFRHWVYSQAAGHEWLNEYTDQFGATRYKIDPYAESRISSWLGKRLIMYDNSIVKSSEKNAILSRFKTARQAYGCELFVVDNLMTAKNSISNEQNYYRAQSNFVGELVDFAQETSSHVILVAHPRKGEEGDENDLVAGSGDITNRASNVLRVKKATESEQKLQGYDSCIRITKGREFGDIGQLNFNFEKDSKRFAPVNGNYINKYSWHDQC